MVVQQISFVKYSLPSLSLQDKFVCQSFGCHSPILINKQTGFGPEDNMARNSNWFLESIGSFFGSGDNLPWTDADIIANCEREALGDGAGLSKDTDNSDSIMRLSWALVHSRRPADVQRGIAMLEAALDTDCEPSQKREILYLLAVGHYRAEDYPRSRQFIDQALQISPDFRQALTLRKVVEEKITKDGVIGIGIAVTAVGLVAGGIAAALARKK